MAMAAAAFSALTSESGVPTDVWLAAIQAASPKPEVREAVVKAASRLSSLLNSTQNAFEFLVELHAERLHVGALHVEDERLGSVSAPVDAVVSGVGGDEAGVGGGGRRCWGHDDGGCQSEEARHRGGDAAGDGGGGAHRSDRRRALSRDNPEAHLVRWSLSRGPSMVEEPSHKETDREEVVSACPPREERNLWPRRSVGPGGGS